MSAVDYSQTLKRMDGWIVEADSFFLPTLLQILALCKYGYTKPGTGQGSLEPFNYTIGTEASGESFGDSSFKTYLGSNVCLRAFPIFHLQSQEARLPFFVFTPL